MQHVYCKVVVYVRYIVSEVPLMLDCEQSLFSQSSLGAAGLEIASASCFLLSLASLDFFARVTILRDCSQSTLMHGIDSLCLEPVRRNSVFIFFVLFCFVLFFFMFSVSLLAASYRPYSDHN